MNYAVLRYEFVTKKPRGIPNAWIAEVRENVDIAPTPDWLIMTGVEVRADVTANKPAYDTWKAAYDDYFENKLADLDMNGIEGKDYLYVRHQIRLLVEAETWADLSVEEKSIAAGWLVVEKTKRDEVFTIDEQVVQRTISVREATQARRDRASAMMGEFYARVDLDADQIDFISGVLGLVQKYIQFGDAELINYLEVDLLAKTYTIDGMRIADLSARLIDIIENGNY